MMQQARVKRPDKINKPHNNVRYATIKVMTSEFCEKTPTPVRCTNNFKSSVSRINTMPFQKRIMPRSILNSENQAGCLMLVCGVTGDSIISEKI